jgi:general stress protein 26
MQQNIKIVDELKSLVNNIGIAMLVTINAAKELMSRPMSTADIDTEGNIWFFTDEFSDKAAEISFNNEVMINYAAPTLKKYISIYGIASLVKDIDQIKDLWNPAFKAWFPDSETNDIVILLKVTPSRIEYWDGGCNKIIVGSNTNDAYKKKGNNNWQALNY